MENLLPLIGGLGFMVLIIGPAVLFEAWTESWERKKSKTRQKQNRDMLARQERLKKELIAHHREQLALEYLNEKRGA